MMTLAAGTSAAAKAAEDTAAEDLTAAEPSEYSPAYLPPKPYVVGPYDGAVASTSSSIVRTPGNHGHVAAYHKTVETPFSSVHKADLRYINDVPVAGPYPYAPSPVVPGPYPVAGPYPYSAGAYPYAPAAGPYPYAPATGSYPYAPAAGPYPYAPAAGPYNYGPAVAPPHAYGYGPAGVAAPYAYGAPIAPAHGYAGAAPVVTPHSVSHASFSSGPYGAHYAYKR